MSETPKRNEDRPRATPILTGTELRLLAAIEDLTDELGHSPTHTQLLSRLGWSPKSRGSINAYLKRLAAAATYRPSAWRTGCIDQAIPPSKRKVRPPRCRSPAPRFPAWWLVARGELNVDAYFLRALLLAGSARPRRPPPAAEDFDAYVEGAAHGLSSALGWAWEMIYAALDIALLTDADSAADFLAIVLKDATPERFPLEHVSFEPTSPHTGQLDLIEQALADTLGLSGRMITSSKSRYMHDHPDHAVSFNANVCLASGKVAHGDLDLTLDEHRLVTLAARIGETVFVLHERDGRFANEERPLLERAVYSVTASGHSRFDHRSLERRRDGSLARRPPS